MDYTNYNTIFHRESENKATIIFKSDKLTEDELRNILVFIRRNNITELTVKGTENSRGKLERFFPASPYFDAEEQNFECYDTNTRSAMGSKKRKSKKI